MGEIIDGVDMRAEVGILTRNVVIQGEMEDSCYGDNQCQFFDYDTFGGHVTVGKKDLMYSLKPWLLNIFEKTFKFWNEIYKDIKKKSYFISLLNDEEQILGI